jgi:hypothetical protein
MKASLKINKILAASVLALAAPCAFGQTISASNTVASINTAFPPGHVSTVTIDRTGATVNGFTFELDYNTAHLSLGAQHVDVNSPHPRVTTVGTGAADFGCVEIVLGTLRCVTTQAVTSATFQVNIAWTVLGTQVPNPGSPLTFDQAASTFVNAVPDDVPFSAYNNGSVTIGAAPPAAGPTLNFSPNGGAILSGSNITISATGGDVGGSSNYNCTAPAGVTVTNNPGAIATGGANAVLNVSCPAGTADAAMTCTRTGGNVADVVFQVDCPAAAAPVVNANPATGAALTCNGQAGSTQTTSVVFTNTGNANGTGFACAVGGAGFSLQTAPAATITSGGGTTTATVACTVPADGAAPINGTLNCTGTGFGPFAYTVSSVALSAAVPTQAAIVPASSLWSKIGLVGLLAVLGMLVVGFRRQH